MLITVGPAHLSREAALLASHTGGLIAILRRLERADTTATGYRNKAGQLRLAVLMALMDGDPTLARRMTAGAVPALLDAEFLRVHLLRCAPDDRDRLVEEHQDPAG
ncbi:hypothetical protein [Streptomyces uncialis]|uniref:hypothetical protein n=1 Tax=Streptomyces uncialis TaxID=1048205 RepID=UPI0037AB5144